MDLVHFQSLVRSILYGLVIRFSDVDDEAMLLVGANALDSWGLLWGKGG